MPRFLVEGPEGYREVDSTTFVSLIQGTVIRSMTAADSPSPASGPLQMRSAVNFPLSEYLQLWITTTEAGDIEARLINRRRNEGPPIRLQLLSDAESPTARLIESRLHSLRQLYAIVLLLDTGRQEEMAAALRRSRNIDLETLLAEDERLYLEAVVPGSAWTVAQTIARGAPVAALMFVYLLYGDGRRMLLDLLATEVEKRRQENARLLDARIIDLTKAFDKVTGKQSKAAIQERLNDVMDSLHPVTSSRSTPRLRLSSERDGNRRT